MPCVPDGTAAVALPNATTPANWAQVLPFPVLHLGHCLHYMQGVTNMHLIASAMHGY